MTLEESTKPAVSIDFDASTKSATPGSYNTMRFVTKEDLDTDFLPAYF